MDTWVEMVEDQHRRRRGKELSMAYVLRDIKKKQAALQSIAVGSWAQLQKAEKAKAKEFLLAQEQGRERFLYLSHSTIMRLHKRLAVTHIFEAWVTRSSL